jgi:hypothetical protein
MDHLVFVARDLDEGIAHIEGLLGVKMQPGGCHQGRGTRNALLALSEDTFLEVLAVDPAQPEPLEPRWLGVDAVTEPTLVTWAAKSSDLPAVVAGGRAAGVDLGEPSTASRQKPDGTTIAWGFSDPRAERNGGLIPFFLDWGDTPHPGASLPEECSFVDITAECPNPEEFRARVEALGLDMVVRFGKVPRLAARIRTPHGVVELR